MLLDKKSPRQSTQFVKSRSQTQATAPLPFSWTTGLSSVLSVRLDVIPTFAIARACDSLILSPTTATLLFEGPSLLLFTPPNSLAAKGLPVTATPLPLETHHHVGFPLQADSSANISMNYLVLVDPP
mmetsp:Transcript_15875/g.30039  ORF Transcript_15875/g.30039 Transcript_15875/m.30039 type:complete len:127 (-) Transcript_15875:643-1023(-)